MSSRRPPWCGSGAILYAELELNRNAKVTSRVFLVLQTVGFSGREAECQQELNTKRARELLCSLSITFHNTNVIDGS
jgi:hypothetical protein